MLRENFQRDDCSIIQNSYNSRSFIIDYVCMYVCMYVKKTKEKVITFLSSQMSLLVSRPLHINFHAYKKASSGK